LELAEDPARPYNYNVSDPRVYEIIEPLMDEILEVFKPTYFHIGHDEIDCARTVIYPTRPENKALGMAELYRRDVWRLHDFLAKRNVKTMIWHDGMCAGDKEEWGNPADLGDIRAFRATLPKDLVVLFWEYSDGRSYGGVRHLQEEGFEVIGCPWYNEGNIKNMVTTAKKEHSLGISGTSWWPMHTWDYVCNAYPPQYPAHLLTACLAWGGPTAEQIPPRRYADIVYDMIRQRVELDKQENREGYSLDLSPLANYLPKGKTDKLLPADFSAALKVGQPLKADRLLKVGRGGFLIPTRDGKLAAIAMQSFPDGPLFPNKVELPMSGKLQTVHLLGALTGPLPDSHNNTKVLDVVFHYADGESETVVMQYNANMGHLHGRASYKLNKTTSIEGDGGRLWDNAVQNPKPEKPVSGVELVSKGLGFVLFGVSGETLPAN
jgi:hypothetical protein